MVLDVCTFLAVLTTISLVMISCLCAFCLSLTTMIFLLLAHHN